MSSEAPLEDVKHALTMEHLESPPCNCRDDAPLLEMCSGCLARIALSSLTGLEAQINASAIFHEGHEAQMAELRADNERLKRQYADLYESASYRDFDLMEHPAPEATQ